MSTTIRPELSEKNKYWIEKHRYYELKHFCLQYPLWKKFYNTFEGLTALPTDTPSLSKSNKRYNPTEDCAIGKAYYAERIELLDGIAVETDPELGKYILKGVTEGLSYDSLKMQFNIPCCKDVYYELYRRFFWLLSNTRN